MTNKVAIAYANLGKAYLDLADALTEEEPYSGPASDTSPYRSTSPTETPGAPSMEELPFDDLPSMGPARAQTQAAPAATGLTTCPAHGRVFRDGMYGPYCTAKADEPQWANKKGYCAINPENARAWLLEHA